jgi:hypothetical protein
MQMSDAPRLGSTDELNKRITHAELFDKVKSRTLKALLQEAVLRMNGFGEDAEPRYQQALAAVREAGGEALDALGREFAALEEGEYVNRWGVVQLLNDLQEPRALSLLDRIISLPMPAERSRDPHSSTAAREVVIRTTAVEAVGRLAAAGNTEARDALLKYARHPVRSVKIAAALAYLEQPGGRGRKELLRRMLKSDHWMLGIRRVIPREIPAIEGYRFLPPKSAPEQAFVPRPASGGTGAPASPRSAPEVTPSPRSGATAPTERRTRQDRPAKRGRAPSSKKG